ncbi:MAG TPA: F0F1 ATP synthase subunit delta, partial [Terracidiphilus sp.]
MAAFVARYARAFADVVTAQKLDTAALDRQLNDFLAIWEASAELRELFANPAVAGLQKVAVLDKMNAKLKLQKELRNLLAVLIKNDRIGEVREVAAAYRTEMQERQG